MLSINQNSKSDDAGFVKSREINVDVALTSHVEGSMFETVLQTLEQNVFTTEFSNKLPGFFARNPELSKPRTEAGCAFYKEHLPDTEPYIAYVLLLRAFDKIPLPKVNPVMKTIELGGIEYLRIPQGPEKKYDKSFRNIEIDIYMKIKTELSNADSDDKLIDELGFEKGTEAVKLGRYTVTQSPVTSEMIKGNRTFLPEEAWLNRVKHLMKIYGTTFDLRLPVPSPNLAFYIAKVYNSSLSIDFTITLTEAMDKSGHVSTRHLTMYREDHAAIHAEAARLHGLADRGVSEIRDPKTLNKTLNQNPEMRHDSAISEIMKLSKAEDLQNKLFDLCWLFLILVQSGKIMPGFSNILDWLRQNKIFVSPTGGHLREDFFASYVKFDKTGTISIKEPFDTEVLHHKQTFHLRQATALAQAFQTTSLDATGAATTHNVTVSSERTVFEDNFAVPYESVGQNWLNSSFEQIDFLKYSGWKLMQSTLQKYFSPRNLCLEEKSFNLIIEESAEVENNSDRESYITSKEDAAEEYRRLMIQQGTPLLGSGSAPKTGAVQPSAPDLSRRPEVSQTKTMSQPNERIESESEKRERALKEIDDLPEDYFANISKTKKRYSEVLRKDFRDANLLSSTKFDKMADVDEGDEIVEVGRSPGFQFELAQKQLVGSDKGKNEKQVTFNEQEARPAFRANNDPPNPAGYPILSSDVPTTPQDASQYLRRNDEEIRIQNTGLHNQMTILDQEIRAKTEQIVEQGRIIEKLEEDLEKVRKDLSEKHDRLIETQEMLNKSDSDHATGGYRHFKELAENQTRQLRTKEDRVKKLENDIKDLRSKNKDLKTKLEDAEETTSTEKAEELRDLTAIVDALGQAARVYDSNMSSIDVAVACREAFVLVDKQHQIFNRELHPTHQGINAALKRILAEVAEDTSIFSKGVNILVGDAFKSVLGRVDHTIHVMEDHIKRADDSTQAANNETVRTKQALTQSLMQSEKQQTEIRRLTEEIRLLKEKQNQSSESSAVLKLKDLEIKSLTEEIGCLKQDAEANNQEKESLLFDLDTEKENNEDLTNEKAKLLQKLANLETGTVGVQAKTEVEMLSTQKSNLNKEIAKLNDKVEQLKNDIAVKEKEEGKLWAPTEKLEDLKKQEKGLENSISEKKRELEKLVNECIRNEKQLKGHDSTNDSTDTQEFNDCSEVLAEEATGSALPIATSTPGNTAAPLTTRESGHDKFVLSKTTKRRNPLIHNNLSFHNVETALESSSEDTNQAEVDTSLPTESEAKQINE